MSVAKTFDQEHRGGIARLACWRFHDHGSRSVQAGLAAIGPRLHRPPGGRVSESGPDVDPSDRSVHARSIAHWPSLMASFAHGPCTSISGPMLARQHAGSHGRLWNGGCERIFGFTAAEATNQTLDIVIPENLRERHLCGHAETMRTGEHEVRWRSSGCL